MSGPYARTPIPVLCHAPYPCAFAMRPRPPFRRGRLGAGVMLLRVCKWSLALLERMLSRGRRSARRRHALQAQTVVKNLCVGCLDDQAVLLTLLHENRTRWGARTLLERRYLLQGYWEDFAPHLPTPHLPPSSTLFTDVSHREHLPPRTLLKWWPLTSARLASLMRPLPPLRRPVFGSSRVPLSVHFAGCQLCSGKGDATRMDRCWSLFKATVTFAEEQSAPVAPT